MALKTLFIAAIAVNVVAQWMLFLDSMHIAYIAFFYLSALCIFLATLSLTKSCTYLILHAHEAYALRVLATQ